jgi:predicted Zn-dependent peptidase
MSVQTSRHRRGDHRGAEGNHADPDDPPPTEAERDLAVASLTLGYPRGFETAQQVARSVAQLALHGLPDSYFEDFVPAVTCLTVDDVTRVAQRYLDPARLLTLVVGDHDVIAGSLGGWRWANRWSDGVRTRHPEALPPTGAGDPQLNYNR